MNAIDLLKADHKVVKNLLAQLSETTERAIKTRTDLVGKLEMELTVHTALEEEILYPAFKAAGAKEEAEMYYEAKEEHRTVDSLVLPDLKETNPKAQSLLAAPRSSKSCWSTTSKKKRARCLCKPKKFWVKPSWKSLVCKWKK